MRPAIVAIAAISTISNLMAGSISVDTSSSATANYGSFSETAGPFPWSDLGFTAGASVSAGTLNVNTGGSTSYALNSTVTGSEVFTPGSTTLNLGYTSGWTGSFSSSPAATGNLNSQFVYNIGPISGSDNLFNVPLSAPAANADLSSSLNLGIPAISSQTVNGPGVSASLTLSAQVFFVTVASVSLGFNIGTQVNQTVLATPTVAYDDLIWYSKTQTYSPTDTFTLVSGSGGNDANTFAAPPGSLGLVTGDTFYMNILPVVDLTMPVSNDANVAVPASITASWDVFGDGGSANYPLGNLFTLDNGDQTFDYDADFYGSQFYSVPLEYTENCVAIACFPPVYETPSSGPGPVTVSNGIPIDIPPTVNITGDGPLPGGYGNTNLGPLFPGDPSTGDICGPAGTPYAGECINQVTTQSTPEPGGVVLLGTGLLLLLIGAIRRKLVP